MNGNSSCDRKYSKYEFYQWYKFSELPTSGFSLNGLEQVEYIIKFQLSDQNPLRSLLDPLHLVCKQQVQRSKLMGGAGLRRNSCAVRALKKKSNFTLLFWLQFIYMHKNLQAIWSRDDEITGANEVGQDRLWLHRWEPLEYDGTEHFINVSHFSVVLVRILQHL